MSTEVWKDAEHYRQGKNDAIEGYPPNRFMRGDTEYMRGYNEYRELAEKAERAKE